MKIMLLGHAQHGKDTIAEMLSAKHKLKFMSSSYFVAERAVRPYLAERGISYATLDECYADRVNHRADWYAAIALYNSADAARLGCELFAEFDIYVGLRSLREFAALYQRRAFNICWWVDASQRIPAEPRSSITVNPTLADITIDNNGSLEELGYTLDWAWQKSQRKILSPYFSQSQISDLEL